MATIETTNVYSLGGTVIQTGQNDDQDRPDYKHPEYEYWMQTSAGSRHLMQGTRGMREAGELFLPKFSREEQSDYNKRLQQSILKNFFRKTVYFLAGQVFQSPIEFTDEFPDEIAQYNNDIDRAGTTVDLFSKRLFENGIATGVSHILVEAPIENEATSRADEQAAGVRPYFKEIRPENVIGWQTDDQGNLIQVRILEMITRPKGTYGVEFVPTVRVLVPGGWQLYQKDTSNEFVLAGEGETNIDVIPIASFIPGQIFSVLTGESPLQDLVDLQIHHWQSFSDQKNILHVGRLPILLAKMLGMSELLVGSSKAIMADNEDADLKFVEIQGAAIEAGQTDLTETENDMSMFGLQMLMDRTGGITATEKAITTAESNSSLAMWVNEYHDTLVRAYQIWGMYIGVEVEPESVRLPSAFRSGIVSYELLKLLLEYVDAGILSKQAVFDTLAKQDVLPESVTWDGVQAEIEDDARNAGPGALAGLFTNLNAGA